MGLPFMTEMYADHIIWRGKISLHFRTVEIIMRDRNTVNETET